MPGEGNITINKRTFEDYFPLDTMRLIVNQPLEAVSATSTSSTVIVNVHGGGMTGQAGAIRHGIARALCVCDKKPIAPFSKGRLSQARSQTERAQEVWSAQGAQGHLNSPRDNRAIWRDTASKSLPPMRSRTL